MGDDRKPEYDAKYEMAPQSEADLEKGEVKIADGGNDEKKSADVDNDWGGLNKAELLEVADTPFWNWTRNILLILFWVGWVAMLVAAIVIVVKVPRCPEVEWWEKSVFYRVVPQSFKDSNGDGYGDFKGLTKKLDYVQGIGANVLVLSSIYAQSEERKALGQEIVDFQDVDSRLGTLKDFDDLMEAAEGKGLKVILEFVPNHSSKDHPWFEGSRNKTGNFSDYYVWQDCGDGTNPPNDWLNKNGDSAWTYDTVRRQCYYAYQSSEQPDLNYDNVDVKMSIQSAIKFWFEHKVDGFIFSDVDYIFESGDVATALGNRRRRQATNAPTAAPAGGDATTAPATNGTVPPSEPETTSEPEPSSEPEPTGSSGSGSSPTQYSCVGDDCSGMQAKLHDLLVSWREIFNDNSYLGKYRLLVTETELAPKKAVLQFGNGTREADLVINHGFAKSIVGAPNVDSIQNAVASWLAVMVNGFEMRWNTWTLGDEDMSRIASRAGEKFSRALNFILLTLPGTPISYYGEELGTPDLNVAGIDASRGPMYWANFTNGNFTASNATAWQPLPTDPMYSVEVQDADKKSSLSVFKKLAGFHSEPSMTAGKYHLIYSSPTVYAYLRQFPDWPGYLVVTNFGSSTTKVDFEVKLEDHVFTHGKLQLMSSGDMPEKKKEMALSDLTVEPATSILVEVKQ